MNMALPSYQRDESAGNRIAAGNYRVVIVSAEEAISKSTNKEMIIVGVRPSGTKMTIKYYIVEGEYYNKNLTRLFDSFDIEDGDMNLAGWVGAMGAAKLKEDENGYLKVAWFISKDRSANLPPFEGERLERQTVTEMEDLDPEEDLPF
jgi:hypothetical protein